VLGYILGNCLQTHLVTLLVGFTIGRNFDQPVWLLWSFGIFFPKRKSGNPVRSDELQCHQISKPNFFFACRKFLWQVWTRFKRCRPLSSLCHCTLPMTSYSGPMVRGPLWGLTSPQALCTCGDPKKKKKKASLNSHGVLAHVTLGQFFSEAKP
jgi:hypothetical protein